ncbi:MAG: sulfotransferase [Gammaproteobacteria bacterium]|nr:sulfotransferase [Gammaproteobacteria bacterium]
MGTGIPENRSEHLLGPHGVHIRGEAGHARRSRPPEKTALAAIQSRIVAKQYEQALAALDVILKDDPRNTDALYMSAVCRRYRREFDAALALLAGLKALAPENGRAHQEEGHAYRDMGRPIRALVAYEQACRFNPALVASWREQLNVLARLGRRHEAAQVKAQLDHLEQLPRPLVMVVDLMSQGKLLKAEDLCRKFLRKVPHHVEAMRLLADIGMRFGVLADAEFLLESAHEFEPNNVRVHMDYVKALRKRQKFAKALEQARQLLDRSPGNPQFQSIYAIECMQTGNYEEALRLFDSVLEKIPGDPITLTSKGHALKTDGQYDQAVASYRAALESQQRHGEAWYSLSNLKVYSFSDSELERMHAQLKRDDLSHADRVHLSFALGKAYEDRNEFETSFGFYQQGNRAKKAASTYDADKMTGELRAQQRVCNAGMLSRGLTAGYPAADPIFVLGLPRAGSTLLEQILSSHSKVDGTLELPNVLSLSQQLRRRGRRGPEPDYPDILEALSDQELRNFGQQFIDDTRIHRAGAPFFVDKMPNNFRHIGLIHLMLPNAKIIDARRHPMACGFSGYKQLFAEGQQFTYGLADLGQYYRDYVELMDHWDAVLPGKVLRVQYEEVVSGLETQVRRILDHCGLEFEPECLNFYRTDRAVRTPSSEQVRQPIFKSGLDYWRNYEPWLDPLKDALGEDVRRRYGV